MKSSVDQCRHLIPVGERLIADLTDAHRAFEPRPGTKTAGWLLGHLAVTGDFARFMCGAQSMCPRDWREKFNPGTHPALVEDAYPAMHELDDTVRVVYEDLCITALHADPAALARPNPYELARDSFPSAGDFVAYLASAHFAYHLGQLAIWRAAAGVAHR
jgi:hypothetical protein